MTRTDPVSHTANRDAGAASARAVAPLALTIALSLAIACGADDAPRTPAIDASDVHRFVDAYRRLDPADTTCAPLGDYVAAAGPGLRAYIAKFDMTTGQLCRNVRRYPRRYAALEGKLGALDSASAEIRLLFTKLAALIPGGRQPDVFFVVGNGISGGTTTHGTSPMVLIGMERNASVGGLPTAIAHEYVHTQQDYPWIGMLTGGPPFLRGSLLRHSIMEGSADLLAELVTGVARHNAFAESHAAELWRDFQRDLHTKDYRLWLYNGWNTRELGDRPGDLGYWMGYLIAKAYYERARDKAKAIREILTIRDFDRFLEASGYQGPAAAAGVRGEGVRDALPSAYH